MVMIKDNQGNEVFSISTRLHEMTQRMKEKIHKDDSQVVGIFFGAVGSGKSVRSMQLAFAVDPTLDIDRICFNKEEFIPAVINNSKCSVLGDEGISLFFARAAMTKEGRIINELMNQVRQKNLCLFINVPDLLSIDKLILDSANFVAYIYESREKINGRMVTIKGNMAVWLNVPGGINQVSTLIKYLRAKRGGNYNYSRPKPAIMEKGTPKGDSFKRPWYPVPEDEYRVKKEAILKKYEASSLKEEEKPQEINYLAEKKIKSDFRLELIVFQREKLKFPYSKIGQNFNITRERASQLYREAVKRKYRNQN